MTTWIFARSLLNAAILGYLYGIAGTLAYAAYYGSFLTGVWIIDAIRFRHGHGSVQSYMKSAFGPFGAVSYNIVVALSFFALRDARVGQRHVLVSCPASGAGTADMPTEIPTRLDANNSLRTALDGDSPQSQDLRANTRIS